MRLLAALVLVAASAACNTRPAVNTPLVVFAPSSLQSALDTLTPALEGGTGLSWTISYAGTSTLARQLESGAPADLFISADVEWMDYVQARQLIEPETRTTLFGNALVLIGPTSAPDFGDLRNPSTWSNALPDSRLAIADPDAVPAGRYAKRSLTSLGVWDTVEPRLARGENVRAALQLVARGEAPLGIVYRTDALLSRDVRILATFPGDSHPPIVYPAAVVKGGSPNARQLLSFLQSSSARLHFDQLGFLEAPGR